MAKSRNKRRKTSGHQKKLQVQRAIPTDQTDSLLDKMVGGREFESLVKFKAVNIDLSAEIRKAISEIQSIRGNPLICYMANIVNSNIKASTSIDNNDDLPFSEMISSIPPAIKEVDILLVTPGGSGQQVAKFVDRLRPNTRE